MIDFASLRHLMQKPSQLWQRFTAHNLSGGLLLLLCACAAMLVANSPWQETYHHVLYRVPVQVSFGEFALKKDVIHWVNDGLMALFFFLVGLEIKREVLQGALQGRARFSLPLMAALGGILTPAFIYLLLNQNNPETLSGWAIPSATDIAFALAALMLLGKRVPPALKIFLLAIAILDDLGAILIIALFYAQDLHVGVLPWALLFIALLAFLNFTRVNRPAPYLIFGVCLWLCVLQSGIHATLAGVVAALFVPLSVPTQEKSLLLKLEHDLAGFVTFVVLPLFAFANAGITLQGMKLNILFEPVSLGVILGLVLGKPLGILLFTWCATRLNLCRLPEGVRYGHVLGMGLLAGIGFTMSLFIGTLAFSDTPLLLTEAKLGIMVGSLFAAMLGVLFLYFHGAQPPKKSVLKSA